jgi:hypothetical protein
VHNGVLIAIPLIAGFGLTVLLGHIENDYRSRVRQIPSFLEQGINLERHHFFIISALVWASLSVLAERKWKRGDVILALGLGITVFYLVGVIGHWYAPTIEPIGKLD